MELAYVYRAKNFGNKIVTGIVYAPMKALGFAKLSKNGIEPIELKLDILESLRNYFKNTFDAKELSRFYATLGRRVNNGKSMVDGLEASQEFVRDNRLKMSALTMRQKILEGRPISDAMEDAGFPRRDAMALKGVQAGSKPGDQLISLAAEITRVAALKRALSSIFRMPIIMAAIMYIFMFLALTKAAPMTMKFLKSTNLKLNMTSFNRQYFDFAQSFNDSLYISSLIYWTIPVGLFFFFRSETARVLVNKISVLRNISEKADMASLWTSFSILYNANAPVKESCRLVAESATRKESAHAFQEMAAFLNTGHTIGDAAMKSSFPDEIQKGVYAAATSGKLVDGLNDMARNLEEDVTVLTGLLQENMKLLALLLVAMGVGFIFMVTYYPIVASVLSNV